MESLEIAWISLDNDVDFFVNTEEPFNGRDMYPNILWG